MTAEKIQICREHLEQLPIDLRNGRTAFCLRAAVEIAEQLLGQNNRLEMEARKLRIETEVTAKLLEAVKSAYRKHHLDDVDIGWSQLSDQMCNALCEAMGDDGFQKWLEEQRGEA